MESSMATLYCVYELIDPRNNQVFYVGKGKEQRASTHKHKSLLQYDSAKNKLILELLSEGLMYVIRFVEYFDNEQLAYNAEAKIIDHYGLDNLTNNKAGGGRLGQWTHSPETVAKIKLKLSDPIIKQAMRDRMLGENNPMYGVTRSGESLQKFKDKVSGSNHFMYGKHQSDETKRKISEKLTGVKLSDEQKQSRSDSMKLVWEQRKVNAKYTIFEIFTPDDQSTILDESLEDFCKRNNFDPTSFRRSAKYSKKIAKGKFKGWWANVVRKDILHH